MWSPKSHETGAILFCFAAACCVFSPTEALGTTDEVDATAGAPTPGSAANGTLDNNAGSAANSTRGSTEHLAGPEARATIRPARFEISGKTSPAAPGIGVQDRPQARPAGQDPASPDTADPDAWNSDRALHFIARAIEARRYAFADSTLERFRADVEGHVYFLGDFMGERRVIRADQIALDVRWQAPDRSMQTVIGRRHEIRLPTNIRYHADHLQLILDNFEDRIDVGGGDEVSNVLHPAGPGAPEHYEYRIADSLEIRVRGQTSRVFELHFRPRVADEPAAVGSLFVDSESGAVARMRLTFTRTAYRDPDLVQITLDLRSALWRERYWLPAEQDIEIVRSLPWFDFPLQTVIRGRLTVLDYRFGGEEFSLSAGRHFLARPGAELARYGGWRSSLYGGSSAMGDDITRGEAPGLPLGEADGEIEGLWERTGTTIGRWGLLGGNRLQAFLPNASAGLRVRRAEGLLVGAGGAYRIDDRAELLLWAGYPTGTGRPEAAAGLRVSLGRLDFEADGWLRESRDVGRSVASGALRTLSVLARGEDYQDPYFASGGRVGLARRGRPLRWRAGISALSHRAADNVISRSVWGGRRARPVRAVDEGRLVAIDAQADLELGRRAGSKWSLGVEAEGASAAVGSFGYVRGQLALRMQRSALDAEWAWTSEIALGLAGGSLPAQRLFLLGGRGTLPGYDFRVWGGDRMALWRGEVSRSVAAPWIRVRGSAAAGWVGNGSVAAEDSSARFGAGDSSRLRASAGVGVGLFYDLLRIDIARGLVDDASDRPGGGGWVLLLSLNPVLRDIL